MNETLIERDPTGSDLVRLVDRGILQKLQARLSALAKVTACICTVDGRTITTPSWGSPFSKLIGTSPLGREAFAAAIRDCIHKPQGRDAPCLCLDGMRLTATPIVHDARQVGTLVTGTRDPRPPGRATLERLAAKYGIEADALRKGATQIDPYRGGQPEQIRRFARVLADTIATLYGQATQIQQQLADLRAVHELAQRLSGKQDLQEILDLIVRRVVDVMPVKACALRLLNKESGELVIKAVHNLSAEYLNKGPVMLDQNAIDATAFAGESVYIEDATTDPRIRYPHNARREGIVSGLCVPMTYRGQTIGVLRVYTAMRHRFTSSEASLLQSIASQAASAIINSRLRKEQVEAERFQRQVETAGEVQRRMLPSRPEHAHLDVGCVYEPTLKLGGDFFDFIKLPDEQLGVGIADVVGKGVPAALLMASVRSALRAHAFQVEEVKDIVARVNRHLCRDTLVSEFATLFYGVFSSDGKRFRYCNAGHVAPLLFRDGRFEELVTGGLVIGVSYDETFEQADIELRSGDVLTMVTDGVTEAMSFEGDAFGPERLLRAIRQHQALDADQLARQLLWDVRRFVGLAEQSDDISIVVVKIH